MKKSEAKDFLPLIKAWAEGKDLQIKLENGWETAKNLCFEEPISHYRIKPEPRTMKCYAVFPPVGCGVDPYTHQKPSVLSEDALKYGWKFVEFVVMEPE